MFILKDALLAAIKNGSNTREALMAIEDIRLMTWARCAAELKLLCKENKLVATKTGWRPK